MASSSRSGRGKRVVLKNLTKTSEASADTNASFEDGSGRPGLEHRHTKDPEEHGSALERDNDQTSASPETRPDDTPSDPAQKAPEQTTTGCVRDWLWDDSLTERSFKSNRAKDEKKWTANIDRWKEMREQVQHMRMLPAQVREPFARKHIATFWELRSHDFGFNADAILRGAKSYPRSLRELLDPQGDPEVQLSDFVMWCGQFANAFYWIQELGKRTAARTLISSGDNPLPHGVGELVSRTLEMEIEELEHRLCVTLAGSVPTERDLVLQAPVHRVVA